MYPKYDYLGDIQDSLLELDGTNDHIPGTFNYTHSQIPSICFRIRPETSANAILVRLGEELITTCCHGIIERAFRCLGGDLQEFLSSLDGVYDVLKLQVGDTTDIGHDTASSIAADDDAVDARVSGGDTTATDTGFICAAVGELIFTTERPVIARLLLGSLKALAKCLYGVDTSIVIEPVEGDPNCYRYLFKSSKADEDNDLVVKCASDGEADADATAVAMAAAVAAIGPDLKMTPATFCKAFPWHFIVNRNLEFVQMGRGFGKLYKSSLAAHGRLATTYFNFKRPAGLTVEFREIVRRSNTPFLIELQKPPGRDDFASSELQIKGQMVFCPESDTLLFIGSPFLDGLDGLTCNGLFISDIPLHDATREVILVGEQARAQDGLRRRMDKLKSSIEEGNTAVKKERKKNVSLLHLIFPAEIAESLWLGSAIEAKAYDNVTMLFSDIVGFTGICSTATPFMVVSMLEQLYKDFDEFCGYFDVYKVETIGDAYCVASGLHRPSRYDAHKVAWMAQRMIEACAKHETHDGHHIKMRIGIHTGTVLTGVVGRKMPRYCLFGHNVTIANKFESGSEECKINISPMTKE